MPRNSTTNQEYKDGQNKKIMAHFWQCLMLKVLSVNGQGIGLGMSCIKMTCTAGCIKQVRDDAQKSQGKVLQARVGDEVT